MFLFSGTVLYRYDTSKIKDGYLYFSLSRRGNAAYSNQAHRDARLTPKGVQQARDAGVAIAATWPNVTAVWSSPLTRCIQTATHILNSVKVPAGSLFLHDYLLERQMKDNVCNYRAETTEIREEWPEFKAHYLPSVVASEAKVYVWYGAYRLPSRFDL